MDVKLLVISGDANPGEIDLKLPAILGRGRNATVTRPHSLVSRKHCAITSEKGRLQVKDLGSLNGTLVGNKRIDVADLPPGELLTVGAVTFRVVYQIPTHPEEERLSGHCIAEIEVSDETQNSDTMDLVDLKFKQTKTRSLEPDDPDGVEASEGSDGEQVSQPVLSEVNVETDKKTFAVTSEDSALKSFLEGMR